VKNLLKDKTCSEDEAKKAEAEIQKLTDQYIKDIEKLLEVKEADLLSM
jgi:ribosome recycling factor